MSTKILKKPFYAFDKMLKNKKKFSGTNLKNNGNVRSCNKQTFFTCRISP